METDERPVGRTYSLRTRLGVVILLGPLFLVVLPLLIVRVSSRLDARWGLRSGTAGRGNRMGGLVLGLTGAALGLASGRALVDTGAGTPLPLMATQRLVVRPPFAYCRNPMTLGTILGYLGVGIWRGSVSAVGIVAALGAALLLRVRLVEEPELASRFGADYVEYRRTTPFLLPRVPWVSLRSASDDVAGCG